MAVAPTRTIPSELVMRMMEIIMRQGHAGTFEVLLGWKLAGFRKSKTKTGFARYPTQSEPGQEDTGLCEFRAGFAGVDESASEQWSSAQCPLDQTWSILEQNRRIHESSTENPGVAGYSTSKCASWRPGRCMGGSSELTTASMALPIWDLVFEDHFDRLSCVPDRNGVLRPNPLSWTAEIGTLVLEQKKRVLMSCIQRSFGNGRNVQL